MYKQLCIAISSLLLSTSNFAAAPNQDLHSKANTQAFLDVLHAPKLSSLTNDGDYKWLVSVILIGKKVEIASNFSRLYKRLTGAALLPMAATNVTVKIADEQGAVVSTIKLGDAPAAGVMDFSWNGKLENGSTAAPGIYHISATGVVNGNVSQLPTAGDFKVKSVAASRDGVILNLDRIGGIKLDDVIKIL